MKALNDQGFRGRDVSLAGGLAVVFAGTAAVVAGYEAYVREEPRGVIVAPVAGPGTAGAVASWRW